MAPESVIFEMISLNLKVTDWLGWLASKLWEPTLCFPNPRVTEAMASSSFLWALGIHTHILMLGGRYLPIELSPNLVASMFSCIPG